MDRQRIIGDLVVRLRIKEDNKLARKIAICLILPKQIWLSMVSVQRLSKEKEILIWIKGKVKYLDPKTRIVKTKFQGACFNFGAMVYDITAIWAIKWTWWVATLRNGGLIPGLPYVSAEISLINYFRAIDDREKLYMSNSATVDLQGVGDVILKMTYEKELKLTYYLYV